LAVPTASRTLLEAVIPYCEAAMVAWLGGRPDQFCSPQTARAMAMAAFRRASGYQEVNSPLAGVACTAGLATYRPKLGSHRAYMAVQTAASTAVWSLGLEKGRRSRADEEQLVSRLLLNVVAAACGIEARLDLELSDNEQVEQSQLDAPQAWQDLLLGRVESICLGAATSAAVFPGAFNPLHVGHRRMAEIAGQMLNVPIAMEISIVNVEKSPLDYLEIQHRVGQFPPEQTIWLTRAATFEEKSRLFPGTTFIVGADTLRRIGDPRYYGNDPAACLDALQRIADRGCRFLVFGRNMGSGFVCLGDLELPEPWQAICREIPAVVFREDVSSTEIRQRETP
jgi:nicotinic acid mononucleotide adenylyltransferase